MLILTLNTVLEDHKHTQSGWNNLVLQMVCRVLTSYLYNQYASTKMRLW